MSQGEPWVFHVDPVPTQIMHFGFSNTRLMPMPSTLHTQGWYIQVPKEE